MLNKCGSTLWLLGFLSAFTRSGQPLDGQQLTLVQLLELIHVSCILKVCTWIVKLWRIMSRLTLTLLCSPVQPTALGEPSASVSLMLGQAHITTSVVLLIPASRVFYCSSGLSFAHVECCPFSHTCQPHPLHPSCMAAFLRRLFSL